MSARSRSDGCVSGSSTFDAEPTETYIVPRRAKTERRESYVPAHCSADRPDAGSARKPSDRRCGTENAPPNPYCRCNPLRIRPHRIKRDAERLMQATREDAGYLRLAIGGNSAENKNIALLHLGQEHVAIRRRPDQPRIFQPAGIKLHLESRQGLRPCILRARNHLRPVPSRLRCIRLRKIRYRDLPNRPRLLITKIRKRRRRRRARSPSVRPSPGLPKSARPQPSYSDSSHKRPLATVLLRRQHPPRWHAIRDVPARDIPEKSRPASPPGSDRSPAKECSPVPALLVRGRLRTAADRPHGPPRCCSHRYPVGLGCRRGRRVMKARVLSRKQRKAQAPTPPKPQQAPSF